MNFGGIGFTLAHELMHGFDRVDEEESCMPSDYKWWDTKSKKDFTAKARCIQEQYGQSEDKKKLAKSTFSENVADHGGVKLAHMAFGELTLN